MKRFIVITFLTISPYLLHIMLLAVISSLLMFWLYFLSFRTGSLRSPVMYATSASLLGCKDWMNLRWAGQEDHAIMPSWQSYWSKACFRHCFTKNIMYVMQYIWLTHLRWMNSMLHYSPWIAAHFVSTYVFSGCVLSFLCCFIRMRSKGSRTAPALEF